MQITRNRILPILAGIALVASAPTCALKQVSKGVEVPSIQQSIIINRNIDDLINKIGGLYGVESFVQDREYKVVGYNGYLISEIEFTYTESGDKANLSIVLLGEKYSRPAQITEADGKIYEGKAHLAFELFRTKDIGFVLQYAHERLRINVTDVINAPLSRTYQFKEQELQRVLESAVSLTTLYQASLAF